MFFSLEANYKSVWARLFYILFKICVLPLNYQIITYFKGMLISAELFRLENDFIIVNFRNILTNGRSFSVHIFYFAVFMAYVIMVIELKDFLEKKQYTHDI